MKKRTALLCLALAILILLSSLVTVFLPVDHCCDVQEGCAVCLLIQGMERLLRSLWLIALAALAFIHLFVEKFSARLGFQDAGHIHATPVQLHVKLSD